MTILVIFLVIAAVFALTSFLRGRAENTSDLQRRYRQLVNLSEEQAKLELQHQLKAVRKRFPGRSERWYLEKIVYDLERDRR